MSEIAITTSQNVNISFKVASIGERMLAFAIDMIIKIVFQAILFYVIFRLLNFSDYLSDLDYWSVSAIVGLLMLPFIFYSLVFESLMNGQTPGKRIFKMKVIKIDGYQASFGDYLMRWFFRLIDVFVSSGAVGIICMLVNKNTQRLGDIVSGTAVISLKNDINISHTILENITEDYRPLFGQVLAFSDNDMRIIKNHYLKALYTNDFVLMNKLADKIKSTLKVSIPEGYNEVMFIDKVIKDYNYHTGKDS